MDDIKNFDSFLNEDLESDKILGFNLGCDAYLTKPFSPLELIERIHAIFRRINFDNNSNISNNEIINISDISIIKL